MVLQGRQELHEGIGRGTEEEEDLDPVAAREFLTTPSKLLQLDSPLVQKVRRFADPNLLRCMSLPASRFRAHTPALSLAEMTQRNEGGMLVCKLYAGFLGSRKAALSALAVVPASVHLMGMPQHFGFVL